MKIIIDIPEEVFDEIYNKNYYSLKGKEALRVAVRNCTPLTKERCKSNNFDIIRYHGYEFDVRYCESPERDGNIIPIGTEEFRDNYLLSKYGDFADEEARKVDDQIYCYVPEAVLKTYSDKDFQKYVDKYFD